MDTRGLTVCALAAPITLARVLHATQGARAAERVEHILARATYTAGASGARVLEPRIERDLAALLRVRGADHPTILPGARRARTSVTRPERLR